MFAKPAQLAALVVSCALLASCGGGGGGSRVADPPDPTFDQGILAFVHTIADGPGIAVGLASSTTGLSSVALSYGDRAFAARTVAGFDVEAIYTDASGEQQTLLSRLGNDNIKLFRDDEIIVWFTGTLANPTIVVVENDEHRYGIAADTDTAPEVQLFHGASTQGALDIYLTATGVDLATVTPLASVGRNGRSAMLQLNAGADQRFRVTPAGDPATVLYDSGAVELTNNSRLHLFITDYFGPGGSAVTIRPLSNNTVFAFGDESTAAELRLFNMVADISTADVHVGTPAGSPVLAGVPYRGSGTTQNITPGNDINLVVTADGMDADVLFDTTVSIAPGTFAFNYIGGLLTDAAQSEARNVLGTVIGTELRPIATGIQVQVYQGSIASATTDVYILPAGQTTADNTPSFVMPFGLLEQALFPTGDYDIVVTATGSNDPVTGPDRVTLQAGNFYTVTIGDAAGGGTPITTDVTTIPLQ